MYFYTCIYVVQSYSSKFWNSKSLQCTFGINQFILLVKYCNKSWSWNFEHKELRVPKILTRGLSFCFRGSSVTLRSSVGKWTKHCDHLSTLILANLSRALWQFELSIKPLSLRRSVTVAEIHITKLISQSCLATGKLKKISLWIVNIITCIR